MCFEISQQTWKEALGLECHLFPHSRQVTEDGQKKAEELSVLDKRLNANFLFGCERIVHKLETMSSPS